MNLTDEEVMEVVEMLELEPEHEFDPVEQAREYLEDLLETSRQVWYDLD